MLAGLFGGAPQPAAAPEGAEKALRVGALGQIDLHVKDQDLARILQLLSIQSQRNIIVTKSVAGSVTADLYSVDFYQALDALLHPNGYGYLERGNFIYVYTQQELKTIQDASRKTTVKVRRLNYITAADAATFVTPLLSSAGALTVSGNVAGGYVPSTADGGANSFAHADTLIIRDYPEQIEEIERVLQQLDVRPRQVLVDATILEAKLTENNAFGVNLTILADFGFDQFTSPASAISNLVAGTVKDNGQVVQWQNILNTSDQSFRLGIMHDNIAAFIDALDKVTDTTVLAKPKLLVLNRQKAQLLVGQRIGYLSTTQTETATTQTVQFLETGTQLALRPFVSDDDMIRLELQPSISTGEVVQVGTTSAVVPNENTERLTTNILVRSGQTVVLGGLFKDETTISRKQVPGVGDIPLLGAAFKGHTDSVTRNEYIFLVTPTVVKDQALYAAGERARDSAELARIGVREGLLPWSRSKLVASHMRDAQAAMERGDKDKALWSANLALHLDSTFVEARRLKEELTGKRPYTTYDSVLEDAIGVLIKQQGAMEKPAAGPAATAAPSTQPLAGEPAPATQPAVAEAPATQPASAEAPATQPGLEQAQAPDVAPAPAAELQAAVDEAPAPE